MYSEQLCTVSPLATNECVTGSVRSNTCLFPIGVNPANRSQFPSAACGLAFACPINDASCASFLPGSTATYLPKERRLPGSIRKPWRLEIASPREVEPRTPARGLGAGDPVDDPTDSSAACRSGSSPLAKAPPSPKTGDKC